MKNYLFIVFVIIVLITSCNKQEQPNELTIIAHRGASGYLPEHTLPAKAMAYVMSPNYIEQDIVLSKDDIPVVIHDIYLDEVTNVKHIFPNRKRKDNRYYVIDFTWEELQQLDVTERFDYQTEVVIFPNRFPKNKSRFKLHTLQQEIEMIQGLNKSTGNIIGIYPEIKEPKFHQSEGKDISKIVLDVLTQYGYTDKSSHCILQCFDYQENKRIRNKLHSRLPLVQLMEYEVEKDSIEVISKYADGIGPSLVFLKDSLFVKKAKQKKLFIHAYTLRTDIIIDWKEQFKKLMDKQTIDGIFTDQPDQVMHFYNELSKNVKE